MAAAAPNIVDASALSGSIRWEVDKDSISIMDCFSPPIEVGGMQWRISTCTTSDKQHLSLHLNQNESDCKMQSVNVDKYELKLINHNDKDDAITKKGDSKFVEGDSLGSHQFVRWSDLIDKQKGFIKDNKITVTVDFSLSNIKGFRKLRRVDFTNENEPSHDIALIIGGEKIYVSKQHLSIHSPVFLKMFSGDFPVKNQKEIELKDIDRKEFMELLYVIYPPSKKIADENVDYLLKLGDHFDIDWVVSECEQFLVTSTKFSVASKLVFASRFRLFVLQVHCLDQLKKPDDVKELKNTPEFKDFSDAIKAALFEKMINH